MNKLGFETPILSREKILNKRPLELAYLGDAVLEIMVREYLITKSDSNKNDMHHEALSFVSAKAQSDAVEKASEMLTSEEMAIFKRARNAKSSYVPKHASAVDYRRATGLEALFGYLYLCGETGRINELFSGMYGLNGENGQE